MAGYLTAKQLLDKAATGIEEADVEVLGGTVKVRGLTAAEDALVTQGSIEVKPGMRGSTKFRADARQRLTILYGLVEPRLDDAQVRAFVATVGAEDCSRIVDKIQELSGSSEDEEDAADAAFPGPA